MMYQDVRGPDGRKLFRFDPERDLVEIRDRGTVYTVDLSQYRPLVEAAVIEVDPLAASGGALDTEHTFVVLSP